MAAPNTQKSPDVNFKFNKRFISPFEIIINTPSIQIINPMIFNKFGFSLKNKIERRMMITGEEV